MAIPKRNMRGLQEIRTYTGKPAGAVVPYMAYMRITCLEMEKARRSCEQDSARRRLNNIAGRFREIEAEKRELLHALRQCSGERRVPRVRRPPRGEAAISGARQRPISEPEAQARVIAPFKVKY